MTAIRTSAAPSVPAVIMGLFPVERFPIADGDMGTAQTIEKIRRLVREGMTDNQINRCAIAIIQQAGIQQFNFIGEIYAIYQWVLGNIRFVRDVFGVETLRHPRETLLTRAGDCDDINAILLPSLLMTIGAHVRLVTVSADPRDPNTFSHIYCEAELPNGEWIPLDAARKNPAFGRAPGQYFRMRRWSLMDSSYQDLPKACGKSQQRMGLSGYFSNPAGYLGDPTDGTDSTDSSGFDWTGLANVLAQATAGAAKIISATTPRTVPTGYAVNPATGQLVPLTPQGTLSLTSAPGGVFTSAAGTFPNWMIFAGMGLAALLLLRK